MFTGLIEEIGTIKNIKPGKKSSVLEIQCKKVLEGLKVGDSVAVNGVCLTATLILGQSFFADVMPETLNRSNLGELKVGKPVNLERALQVNDRFNGHIVSGHIDGTGIIKKVEKDDNAIWYEISCGQNLLKYIVFKGSIAIDGISLTVSKLTENTFSVSIIPHTNKETILQYKTIGDKVNLENDMIPKYIERLLLFEGIHNEKKKSKITKEFLFENGF